MSKTIPADLLRKIENALARGGNTHTLDDVISGLRSGVYASFNRPNSILVCELVRRPRSLSAHCFLAAGRLHELEALYGEFETWARAEGADRLTLVGRRGWERVGKRFGWDVTAVEMTKSLVQTNEEAR